MFIDLKSVCCIDIDVFKDIGYYWGFYCGYLYCGYYGVLRFVYCNRILVLNGVFLLSRFVDDYGVLLDIFISFWVYKNDCYF